VKAAPTILFYSQEFIDENLSRERVMHGDVLEAIRKEGIASLEQVAAVVLESDGTFSILSSLLSLAA
jgi:uncharacterized membrane protein YcaP (DUF421 family)